MRPFPSGSKQVLKTASKLSPSSGRLQTGFAPRTASTSYQAVSLPAAEIRVHYRPVTGTGGVAKAFVDTNDANENLSSLQYARQVQDTTYFVGLLRQKINAISGEMKILKEEKSQMETERKENKQMEREVKTLLSDVQKLEGNLADHNLTLDKLRSSIRPEDLYNHKQQITEMLERTKLDVDDVFISKQKVERSIKRMEQEMNELFQKAESRLRQAGDCIFNEFEAIMQSRNALRYQCNVVENQLIELLKRKQELTSKETTCKYQNEYDEVKEGLKRAISILGNLKFDLKIATMESSDAHQSVVAKVQEMQGQTKDLERSITATKKEIEHFKKDIVSLQQAQICSDINEMDKQSRVQKRKMMQQFLDSYEDTQDILLKEKSDIQVEIAELLEKISSEVAASQDNLPSVEQLKRLKDEVAFKKNQLETSRRTIQSLHDQKRKRQDELKKLFSLEERIENELTELRQRQNSMGETMEDFSNEEGFLINANDQKENLIDKIELLTKKVDDRKVELRNLSAELDLKNSSIKNDPVWKTLDSYEGKIKKQEENIFSLKDAISKKKHCSGYTSEKEGCLQLVNTINNKLLSTNV